MSVAVTLAIKRRFLVAASCARVFQVLADVPYSVSHFPKVRRLEDLGGGVFRWEFEGIGAVGIHHKVVYACRYISNEAKGTVEWTPIDGVGNGEISGAWRISAQKDTCIDFHTDGALQIPAPGMLKPIVAPVVKEIFDDMIDEYISNLCRTFELRK